MRKMTITGKGLILRYRSQVSNEKVKHPRKETGVLVNERKFQDTNKSFIRKIIWKKIDFEAGLESDFLFHFLSRSHTHNKSRLIYKAIDCLVYRAKNIK